MIYHANAPLRIGIGGGGTDTPAYAEQFGGQVFNATIDRFAKASITIRGNGGMSRGDSIVFHAWDMDRRAVHDVAASVTPSDGLDLLQGTYNSIMDRFKFEPLPFKLQTLIEAPIGSGLGSSSTLVVAMVSAFLRWRAPGVYSEMTPKDIAHLAWEIERKDLGLSGGKQDQYCAAFGGFNLMKFMPKDQVIVWPLNIPEAYIMQLTENLVLYAMGTSRVSSHIIDAQTRSVASGSSRSIEAMHALKAAAQTMADAVVNGQLNSLGEMLHQGWEAKKATAREVSNSRIDDIYSAALAAGATGGKISGAGGGGVFMFYCPFNSRYTVLRELKKFGGEELQFAFHPFGVKTWIEHDEKQ